jgi:formiminotetrahydrofolate cyclodeaminase
VLDLKAYLNRLASAEPTPGGGSAATLVGALGAALVAMVARITLGSEKHRSGHANAVMLVEVADALRAKFVAARPEDEAAYAAVVAAQALPRKTDIEKILRVEQLQTAMVAAAEAPLRVAALAEELLDACEQAARLRNGNLISDVECACAFGRAALDASAANVRINHYFIKDAAVKDSLGMALTTILLSAAGLETRTKAIIAEG